MAVLTSLPNELLAQIIEHCDGDAHPNAVYALLFTCKTLHSVAKDIICRHIYLSASKYSDSRLECFLDQSYADSKVASISLQFEKNLLLQMRYSSVDALNRLEPFYPRLRGFSQLTTFSLHQKGHNGYDIVIPSSVVHKILANLPKSVISLDIDTSGCKDHPEVVSGRAYDLIDIGMSRYQHICHEISRLMSQLKCLRLRVPYLCPEIVRLQSREYDPESQAASPLQVIMIRLDSTPDSDLSRIGTYGCTRSIDPLSRSFFRLSPDELCDNLGYLVQQGVFPDIKAFRVAYWQPGEGIIRDLADGGSTELSWHRYGGDRKCLFVYDTEHGLEWTEYPNGTRWPGFMGRCGSFNVDSSRLELRR
jgi:hypothetical protein